MAESDGGMVCNERQKEIGKVREMKRDVYLLESRGLVRECIYVGEETL